MRGTNAILDIREHRKSRFILREQGDLFQVCNPLEGSLSVMQLLVSLIPQHYISEKIHHAHA